jgi:phage shock protein PspC (stress-responsive transcriptional regulator)
VPTPAPTVLCRSDEDRWLGGVCAGLAHSRGVRPAWIRAAFVAAGLLGGLGVLVYVTCWLIIPPATGAQTVHSGWVTVLAQASAACAAIVTTGVVAAAATLFGFGWIVVALAGVILIAVVVAWPRLGPAWALLPIAALVLPSLAVAASGLALVPQAGSERITPVALGAGAPLTVRAGLGTMLVDLRRTALPASGEATLRVDSGVRRTIIALPADRCVHIVLRDTARPLPLQLAAQLGGELPVSGVEAYGRVIRPGSASGTATFDLTPGNVPGPRLRIDVTSLGGSLIVRDFPNSVDPNLLPSWPGYRVFPEPRPDIRGVPHRAARRLVRAWRSRRAAQLRSQRAIDALMPGPCAPAGVRR